jgi:hypothetical protein
MRRVCRVAVYRAKFKSAETSPTVDSKRVSPFANMLKAAHDIKLEDIDLEFINATVEVKSLRQICWLLEKDAGYR